MAKTVCRAVTWNPEINELRRNIELFGDLEKTVVLEAGIT